MYRPPIRAISRTPRRPRRFPRAIAGRLDRTLISAILSGRGQQTHPTYDVKGGPDIPSDTSEDRGHLAEDRRVGAVDRVVRRVVRQQPDLAVLALEGLDGRLAVDQRRHDLAVLGGLLLADHDVVAAADRCVDHRVAP